MSNVIAQAIEIAGYSEVAVEIANQPGIYEIAMTDELTTIRVCMYDGDAHVHVIAGGRAKLHAGSVKLTGELASPAFIATTIAQVVAKYI
jgi:hypothetical protein